MRETFKKEVETQRTEFAARKRKEEEHIEHVLTQLRRQSTEDDERLRQEKLELDKKLSLSLNATEERMLALRMAHARRKLEVEQQGEMELESLRLEQERHIKDLSLKAYQHTLQLQHQQQEAVEEIERTRESNDRKFKEQSRLLKKTRDAVQKAVQNADQLQTVTQSQMELMLGKQKESEDRRRLLQKEREHALGEMADILARVKSAIVEEPTLNTDLGFKPFSQILFEKHDKAGNGEIDRTEFRNLCYEAGHFLTPEELPSAFEAADADGDGVVCYENFVNWWRSYHKFGNLNLSDADTKRRQRSVEVFHRFDEDHDGSIDIREFPAFFAGLQVAGLVPEDMSRATCLQELDEDSNGVVELNEYVQWLWSYKLL
jgi:Ca2+-binding EF-hand superfamily protein